MSFFLAAPEEWIQYIQMKHTTLGLEGKRGFRRVMKTYQVAWKKNLEMIL